MQSNLYSAEIIALIKDIPGLDAEYAITALGRPEALIKVLLQITRVLPAAIQLMDEYLAVNNALDLFKIKVHGIKGSLRQTGYPRLARSAELLETQAAAGNILYCREHYPCFKQDLLGFLEQLNAIFKRAEPEPPAQAADLRDCSDTLMRAKAAIEDFDSLLAAELLAPLAAKRFGGGTDAVIASLVNELENYRPEAALAYIQKLIPQ